MKNLFAITHTESVHHIEGKVGGWYDTGLTPKGLRDARAVAGKLAALVEGREAEIFTSDLLRATQTAQTIGEKLGCSVACMAGLREISYGIAEGRPQDWLDVRYVPAPDDDRLDHHCGIEGAETRRDVAKRVYPDMDAILARPCETQIVVTHGFALTFVIAAWMKLPIEATGFLSFPAKSGSITHLHQDDFWRNRSIVSLGDISHLEG